MWTDIASLVIMIIRISVMDIGDDYERKKPCVAGVERIRLSKTLSAAGSRKSKTNLELVKLIKLRTGTKLVKYSDAVIYNVYCVAIILYETNPMEDRQHFNSCLHLQN